MSERPSSFPGRSLRRIWRINPVTRVHDNDIRRDKKKERQAAKKRLAEELRDDRRPFALTNGGYRSRAASPRQTRTPWP